MAPAIIRESRIHVFMTGAMKPPVAQVVKDKIPTLPIFLR
jgi:hypothetical protein